VKLRDAGSALLAGFGATTVHVVLMWLKHRTGVLPAFEPYADMQRLLSSMLGRPLEPALSWLISYVNGALILGFVFGRLYARLPGASALAKGVLFGLAAWLAMGFGFFPLAGRGIFARSLGLGALPAALMLAMLMSYAIVMSLLYAWLKAPAAPPSKRAA